MISTIHSNVTSRIQITNNQRSYTPKINLREANNTIPFGMKAEKTKTVLDILTKKERKLIMLCLGKLTGENAIRVLEFLKHKNFISYCNPGHSFLSRFCIKRIKVNTTPQENTLGLNIIYSKRKLVEAGIYENHGVVTEPMVSVRVLEDRNPDNKFLLKLGRDDKYLLNRNHEITGTAVTNRAICV